MPKGWLIAHLVWAYGGTLAAVIVGGWALWRGGPPERRGAAIMLLSWFITPLVDNHHGFRYGMMLVDALTDAGYVVLSLRWRRVWTLLIAAFQLNGVLTHFAAVLVAMSTWAYITAADVWGGIGIVAIMGWNMGQLEKARRTAAHA